MATAPKAKDSIEKTVTQSSSNMAEILGPVDPDQGEGIVPALSGSTHRDESDGASQATAAENGFSGPPTEDDPARPIQVEPGGQDSQNSNPCSQDLVIQQIIEDSAFLFILGLHLDTPHRVIKNYEHLAWALDVPADIRTKCKLNTEYSPTEKLFELLAAQCEDLTVSTLIAKLTRMGRNDVVGIIKQHIPDAGSFSQMKVCDAVNQKSELVCHLATKLDESSRVNKYWLHLGQCLGLKKQQLDDLKCGSNPMLALMEYIYDAHKPDITLREFEKMMKNFDRMDVVTVLKGQPGDRSKKMSDIISVESECMASICRNLSKPVPGLKGWKNVASDLKVPRDIYKDFNPKQLESPTKMLFQWFGANKPDLTVEQVCAALEEIGRRDVILLLREKFGQSPQGLLPECDQS